MKTMLRLLVRSAALALLCDLCPVFIFAAMAQSPSDAANAVVNAVCNNQATVAWVVATILGTGYGAALLKNWPWIHSIPYLGAFIRMFGGTWANWLNNATVRAAKSAGMLLAVIALGLSLAACGTTSLSSLFTSSTSGAQVSTNLQTFAAQTGTYVANFNQNVATIAAGAANIGIQAGQSACGAASMLNGVFAAANSAGLITAVGGDTSDVTTEQATWLLVQADCAIVDAANPANPSPTAIQAAATVATQVPTLLALLKNSAPAVAAQVQSTAAPAPAPSSFLIDRRHLRLAA